MSYQKLANLYDKLMDDAPYNQWIEFTGEIFSRTGSDVQTIADLGCGTGQIASLLAHEGYDVIGVDNSADMLSVAQQRAQQENLAIQWIQQDLRQLQGLQNLDAAVSYCDVINYITDEDEVRTVFERVAKSLKPGGLFLFDIHSVNHVEQFYVNQTFADVQDDVSYIWFCTPGENQGEMYHDLTFFVSDGEKYDRFEELHHQQTYYVEFYKKLLHESGFKLCGLHADFSVTADFDEENAERIFIIAQNNR
ncbi:class I SAM-dependent DNA methyltransferase [Virgibacillus siamensis]|uniref:class I SAM-dependent DNA methyltransferase n=1 Tax=Virgibacillus siamensis TaxID=480071 RepID=UPI000985AD21|nr:class I SAM-dependent methyltransferase [Virgibacillus siamensis]